MEVRKIVYSNDYKKSIAAYLIGPNLEKIISRSSLLVTGFSLQTNNTFSGGFISASGKSPTERGGQWLLENYCPIYASNDIKKYSAFKTSKWKVYLNSFRY